MSFVTPADFLKRYDERTVAQLCSDTGTPIVNLTLDANLLCALEDASGEIVLHALRGGRYSEDDLTGLTGTGRAALERMVSDIAMYFLVLRRGGDVADYPQFTDTLAKLEQLNQGHIIFPLADNIEAGHAQSVDVSFQTILNSNFIRDAIAYFPVRRIPNQF